MLAPRSRPVRSRSCCSTRRRRCRPPTSGRRASMSRADAISSDDRGAGAGPSSWPSSAWTPSRTSSPSPPATSALLKRQLSAAQPTALAANLPAALSVAGSLAEGHADAQVVVVGDGSLDRSQVPANFHVPVRYLGVGAPTAEQPGGRRAHDAHHDGRLSALARVVNNSSQPASATLSLRVDGTRFDARSLSIAPNSDRRTRSGTICRRRGTHARSQPRSAGRPGAGQRRLGRARRRPADARAAGQRRQRLRRARAEPASGTQVTRVSPGDYSPQPDQAYDLIVLDGFVPPSLPAGQQRAAAAPAAQQRSVDRRRRHPRLDRQRGTAGRPTAGRRAARRRAHQPVAPPDRAAWADVVLTSPETPLLLVGEHDRPSHRRPGLRRPPVRPAPPAGLSRCSCSTCSTGWCRRRVPRRPWSRSARPSSLAPLPEAVSVDVVKPDGQRVQVGPPLPTRRSAAPISPGLYQVIQQRRRGPPDQRRRSPPISSTRRESQTASGQRLGRCPSAPAAIEPLKAPQEFWEALVVVGLVLLAIEAALAWWQFARRTLRARLALALRVIIAALLVLALIGVGLPQVVDRQATVFVADVSASARQAQPSMADFITPCRRRQTAGRCLRGRHHRARRAPSAAGSRPWRPPHPCQFDTRHSRPTAPICAAGLRLAADLLPTGYRPRVVLLSDGQETSGDAVSPGASAAGPRRASRRRARCRAPAAPRRWSTASRRRRVVNEGERFSIGVHLVSNAATDGTVHVFVNGQPIADQAVSLDARQHRPVVRRPGAAGWPARRARHARRRPGHADAEQHGALGRRGRRVRRAC